MADRLLHRLRMRGPDREWFEFTDTYGLVQTRLSVIDVSDRVTYPLRNETGDLLLLFNGEIYDHDSHRKALERRGHRFRTRCDAEVVVHGFEEHGCDLFSKLDGMFALALLHLPSRELILARDAVGIKPLVHTTGGRFAFASDAISLVAAGLSRGAIDERAVGAYLACHYVPPPCTGIADLRQLEPGEMMRRDAAGTVRTVRWRQRPFSSSPVAGPPTVEEVAHCLDTSVRSQLVADVPLGVFLSSGLDSSLVLDSAVRSGIRPTAFTIGFGGRPDYDEARRAARLAQELGVPHVIGEFEVGFVDSIEAVSAAFDAPFADASAIATLQLARLARAHVTVGLSGTGGDDLFAGYYRHRAHLFHPLLDHMPASVARWASHAADGHAGGSRSVSMLARGYAARMASTHGHEPFAGYVQLVTSSTSALGRSLSRAPQWAPAGSLSPTRGRAAGSVLRTIQATELATYLPGDLLPKEDRATMAVGLEGRVPLLSSSMLALAERTADQQKINLRSGKRILRQVAQRRLPGYVTTRRKRGFAVPLGDLFSGPWRADAVDWLRSANSSMIDGERAGALLAADQLPSADAWALAVLAGWEGAVQAARLRSDTAQTAAPRPSQG